jgi:protein-S-isoprenylcysteine O-methyltransferase Ste14
VSQPETRSRAALILRSFAAALWFAAWFFVAFPALILWASGQTFPPDLGLRAALGVSVILLAHYVLLQHMAAFVDVGEGTHAPFDPPRKLVVRGLYRRVRNPMYLIYLVIIAGEALLFGSWWLLAYAGGFWALAHLFLVGVEEKQTRARFGEEWDAYARAVPRWIPGRRRG